MIASDQELFRPLSEIDWADLGDLALKGEPILRQLAEPDALFRVLYGVADDPDLLPHCEHQGHLHKLVLFRDDEAGHVVRMHVFREGASQGAMWIHNHRWNFAAMVLRGYYQHSAWAEVGDPDGPVSERFRLETVRAESPGSWYAIDHSAYHAVVADVDTASLILRGPAASREATYVPDDGSLVHKHLGAHEEAKTERGKRQMTRESYLEVVRHLEGLLRSS